MQRAVPIKTGNIWQEFKFYSPVTKQRENLKLYVTKHKKCHKFKQFKDFLLVSSNHFSEYCLRSVTSYLTLFLNADYLKRNNSGLPYSTVCVSWHTGMWRLLNCFIWSLLFTSSPVPICCQWAQPPIYMIIKTFKLLLGRYCCNLPHWPNMVSVVTTCPFLRHKCHGCFRLLNNN